MFGKVKNNPVTREPEMMVTQDPAPMPKVEEKDSTIVTHPDGRKKYMASVNDAQVAQ